MKKIAFIFVMLFSFLAIHSVKVSAAGCTATCKFSTCTIGNCAGQYACGCYFGLAFCKCEDTKNTSTKKMDNIGIEDFQKYAQAMRNPALINLGNILGMTTPENFDAMFEMYQSAIESLSSEDLALLNAYLG
ncbi:hypothetical protein [Edaphocola aurantiacus]|uniref:hypothetical protein n=1 Tax=Edaphocola aurantiacus TaxID=2601682 RepID=UPI001C93DB8F|nr:hypothetical protein [Edaphocola aurantiacus]